MPSMLRRRHGATLVDAVWWVPSRVRATVALRARRPRCLPRGAHDTHDAHDAHVDVLAHCPTCRTLAGTVSTRS